ncbi:MAG: hypothetical protein UF433_07720, partial [Clostridium sp.]|nr:hypothetical protein [Clostridium sp.]
TKVIRSSQQLHNLNIHNIQFLKQPPKDGLFVMRLREWIPSTSHFQSYTSKKIHALNKIYPRHAKEDLCD